MARVLWFHFNASAHCQPLKYLRKCDSKSSCQTPASYVIRISLISFHRLHSSHLFVRIFLYAMHVFLPHNFMVWSCIHEYKFRSEMLRHRWSTAGPNVDGMIINSRRRNSTLDKKRKSNLFRFKRIDMATASSARHRKCVLFTCVLHFTSLSIVVKISSQNITASAAPHFSHKSRNFKFFIHLNLYTNYILHLMATIN